MRKVITTIKSIKDNLRDINLNILAVYILTVDLGDNLITTTTETYR
jgi:hypothetical protein